MEENGNQIVDNQVLSEFRNQWRQELQTSQVESDDLEKSEEEKAKMLFLQGVDLERKGKCFEAMRLYRKAVQLVPDIEFKIYSQTSQQKQKAQEKRNNNFNSSDPRPGSSRQNDDFDEDVDDLVEVFQRELSINNLGICESTFSAATISTNLHISTLPVEVFLVILKWMVSNDLDFKSLERFGSVCKGFYLLSRDQEIWKIACTKVWGANVSPTSTWREMFISRPRVNFNGCYISKINYQRYGENSFQDQFYRPLQTVEYFRLIRFLPNGKMMMMTSADELQNSVGKLKNVQNAMLSRDVLKGHYHYQDSTVILIIKKHQSSVQKFKRKVVNDGDLLTFLLQLDIQDTPKKKFAKLSWKHYAISQFRAEEEFSSDFDLRSSTKYPPFYFSHVKSFHSETNDCLKI